MKERRGKEDGELFFFEGWGPEWFYLQLPQCRVARISGVDRPLPICLGRFGMSLSGSGLN